MDKCIKCGCEMKAVLTPEMLVKWICANNDCLYQYYD